MKKGGRPEKDLTGLKFGKLTVIRCTGEKEGNNYTWECICDCGGKIIKRGTYIKTGINKSCGCIAFGETVSNRVRTHGGTILKELRSEYSSWRNMKVRCLNKKNTEYFRYGARGIIICERWINSFSNFLSDMGRKPSTSHTIDRIDGSKGYDPNNCRWATKKEQADNTVRNVKFEYNGITLGIKDWGKILKVSYQSINFQLKTKSFNDVVFHYKNKNNLDI